MSTVAKKVEELVAGNRVDLESCPFLKNHPSAQFEYAVVSFVERDTPDCVDVGYEGIDHIGYPVGTVLQVCVPKDVPDPVVRVHPLGKPDEWTEWKISQNLTDRCGELNVYYRAVKPLELLEDNYPLLERLRSQMWDELTFIARKDGQFGILFEAEFCSQESEESVKDHDSTWYAELKPHKTVVEALLRGMATLAERFPGVHFAVPEEVHMVQNRPAAWAFVADGLLSPAQLEELGTALLAL